MYLLDGLTFLSCSKVLLSIVVLLTISPFMMETTTIVYEVKSEKELKDV